MFEQRLLDHSCSEQTASVWARLPMDFIDLYVSNLHASSLHHQARMWVAWSQGFLVR